MQNTKTFRLFISSTFNDFRREREVLQTEVFPHIKEYCSKKGYTFQPIDLRWGINEEAQLDQKTLELCLDEVRSCKSYPYPNFLVMLGDRYGWIPLPYAVESREFEEILSHVDDEEKELLLQWYIEDLNQLPASYILKERTGEYADFGKWGEVEDAIRSIFQKTVQQTSLSQAQQRKYFLSATEAEIEEGIIPYINPTAHQEKLLQNDPTLKEVDQNHIFGFFRDVKAESKSSDKFMAEDYSEAQNLKQRVKDELIDKNILQAHTVQQDEKSLDEQYLAEFEQRIVSFLESKVDEQIDKEQEFTPLEIELQAQEYFAKQKCHNFMGQEELLETIGSYIKGDEEQPLIIYGASGLGKSSLMAKAIEQAKENGSKKVFYRFVGATPHSGSSKEILISLFEELGVDVRSEQEKGQTKDGSMAILEQNQETFEQFSDRIFDEMMNIKEDAVILIDAVDQLGHNDQFLWLPKNLPSNVKIVISALDDEKYSDDSRYFQTLKAKSDNLYEIPAFSESAKLLHALLRHENRTVQKHQEEYFLKQYTSSASPLYISVAVQEMKHWKSFDGVVGDESTAEGEVQDLADSQQGIIQEYISNLSDFYHHDKALVQKVLGYIYASRDGLSESEILQLLSIDEGFVKQMAPDTWHENKSGGLPMVIWTRLYAHLKPFLSQKTQDSEELLYFFHREFEEVVSDFEVQRKEHDKLIGTIQGIISAVQNKDFNSNRWGKLYIASEVRYELIYEENLKEFSEFIGTLYDTGWIESFMSNLIAEGDDHNLHNRVLLATIYHRIFMYSSEPLYLVNPDFWAEYYSAALSNLAVSYKAINKTDKAVELEKECLNIRKPLYENNPEYWAEYYTTILNGLAFSYSNMGQTTKAIVLEEESLDIRRKLYQDNPERWQNDYVVALNNLASSYYDDYNVEKAIVLQEESLEIRRKLYEDSPNLWAEAYVIALNNLALSYDDTNKTDKAIQLQEESLKIIKKLYQKNPDRYVEYYVGALNNLIFPYTDTNQVKNAMKLGEENLSICKELYQKNPDRWVDEYTNALASLALSYEDTSQSEKIITLEEKYRDLLKEYYYKNPNRWATKYTRALNNLALAYRNRKQYKKTIVLEEENLNVIQMLCDSGLDYWIRYRLKIMEVIERAYREIGDVEKAKEYEDKILFEQSN